MNILHVLSQRPDSTGSGIYIRAMICEAARHGFGNFLVAGSDPKDSCFPQCPSQAESLFIDFNSPELTHPIVGMSDVMPYKSVRFCDLGPEELDTYEKVFSRRLQEAVRRFNPDVIHSHHLWIVSSLTRRLFSDIPMVTSCHGSDLRQFQNCSHLQQRVLSGCRDIDRVLALHTEQKKDIVRLYGIAPERIAVIGAGYNQDLFYPGLKPEKDPVRIVYAGKLSRAKGVPWLLRCLKSVRDFKWELHLVGNGSGEEKNECLRLGKNLGERAIFHGAVDQMGLSQIMRDSHILVLPSFYEGLPLVILEGLACGCRVVATDLPGSRELAGDIPSNYVDLIAPPRLHRIDQPYEQDGPDFEKRLAAVLQKHISSVREYPEPDPGPLQDKLESYAWPGIFEKVSAVYKQVLD
ncbi:MAG: glycosyltransferase family 4 protein, partial [Thermodesulfobacteriota bacterium]